MPTRPNPPDEPSDLEEIPGFAPVGPTADPIPWEDETEDLTAPDPTPSDPTPSSTSTPPPTPPKPDPSTGGSTPGLSQVSISEAVDDALVDLGGNLFATVTMLANRAAQKRTRTQTRAWIATDEETEIIGQALARIAERHAPDELTEEGDVSDAFVIGSTMLGYAIRNVAGIDDQQVAAMVAGDVPEAPAPPTAPPTTAPAPRQPPPATAFVDDGGQHPVVGVSPATPPPPSVIDPTL